MKIITVSDCFEQYNPQHSKIGVEVIMSLCNAGSTGYVKYNMIFWTAILNGTRIGNNRYGVKWLFDAVPKQYKIIERK